MIEYKPAAIRTWSILGQRGTFGIALSTLAKENERIIALSADLTNTSGLDRFQASFPDRMINVGIAEQNMVGVAAGMAACGYIPFATTFSNFLALRACEQVRHFLGYMQENVIIVGLAAGFSMGMFGVTHYGIEDIATMRSISGLTILSPADGIETVKCVEAASIHKGSVYLRLTGAMNAPILYKEDFEYRIGKANCLRNGESMTIISTGSVTSVVMKAADILSVRGIEVAVYDMHTIKPIDKELLDKVAKTPLLVTVEEHSTIGGLGSAVAEYYAEKLIKPRHKIIGVPQGYPMAGDYEYLLEACGLTDSKLAAIIENAIQ